jgi:pimeloyl-ACP methyl ester carboxylesterase
MKASEFARLTFVLGISSLAGLAGTAQAQGTGPAFASHTAQIDGSGIYYRMAGTGPALILLHGYAQTSRMWNGIMPELAKRFTVIVPDLPGIGQSDIPATGLDMTTAAKRIHLLVRSLGVTRARVVGHDIGLMVAYAYAAQFPAEVDKLVEMDAFLPGIGNWAETYDSPALWHFRFHGPYPERLVRGREGDYFSYYWNVLAADSTHSLSAADRRAYVAAYSRPGRMRAGWGYFDSFPRTAQEFAQLAQTKLTMPVLVIGGDRSGGTALGEQVKLVANDVTVVVLKDTGHWLIDERPRETAAALLGFL